MEKESFKGYFSGTLLAFHIHYLLYSPLYPGIHTLPTFWTLAPTERDLLFHILRISQEISKVTDWLLISSHSLLSSAQLFPLGKTNTSIQVDHLQLQGGPFLTLFSLLFKAASK